jgi:3-oxoacyl-[acyl-carrier protein] reductase
MTGGSTMKLRDKVALITGSGSGMGRESAILFSREGAKVCVVDVDEIKGEQTVDIIKKNGGEAISVKADVSVAIDSERMVKETVETFGRLDILFNNAGILMPMTLAEEVSEKLWDRVVDINMKGIFLGCKYAIPIMKKQAGGVIINTASVSAVRPRPKLCAYTAAKGGAILLTKALAVELGPFNIRVNCLNPGPADTPMLSKFLDDSGIKGEEIEKTKESLVSGLPLGRLLTPQDIAPAALFLASDDAALVTGIAFGVDAGRGI